jgi:hypothetical protein
LKGPQQPERFVNPTTNGKVIDRQAAHYTFRVDEDGPQRYSGIFQEHAIIPADLLGEIAE